MSVRFRKEWGGNKLDPVLKKISEIARVDDDGRVSWSDFTLEIYFSVVYESFVRSEKFPRRQMQATIRNSVLSCLKQGKLTAQYLLKEVNRQLNQHYALPKKRFTVVTDVALELPIGEPAKKFEFDGCTIELTRRLPKFISESGFRQIRRHPYGDAPEKYHSFLITRCYGRNELEATSSAFAANGVLLSVINLAAKSWNFLGGEQKPQVLVYEGPYHFVFSGKNYVESGWYNPDFRSEFWRCQAADGKRFVETSAPARKALKLLHAHPLRSVLIKTLAMMNDGMRSHELSQRTLYYWTAIERLFSAEGEKTPTQKIIERAIFLEKDKKEARTIIDHLAYLRNERVHHGMSFEHQHQVLEYAADLIRRFVFYLIFNADDLLDHKELLEMADLPSSREALERRRRAIDRRILFMETKRHRIVS